MSKCFSQAARLAVWLALAPLGARAMAQATVEDVLRGLAARAGVIFSGRVESITRNDAAGFIDVRFRVEQAVRGCPKTGAYVLREWAGQWTARPARYTVGQHVLMLLAARGPSGMSAPVDGLDGVIPIVAVGFEPMADRNGVAPPEDGSAAPEVVADLRRLQTRVMRQGPAMAGATARLVSSPAQTPASPWLDPWLGAATPLHHAGGGSFTAQPALSTVLAVLRGGATTTGGAHAAR